MTARTQPAKRVQLLLSGGIDSAACLAFLLHNGFSAEPTFVDFGQPARMRESRAARQIADFYKSPLAIVSVQVHRTLHAGEILGRNGFLLFTGMLACATPPAAICIGVHAGTSYLDCSRRFVNQVDEIISELSGGRTRVFAPFVDWNKSQIVAFAHAQSLPLELTYSCEAGDVPCGKCASCKDRETLKC